METVISSSRIAPEGRKILFGLLTATILFGAIGYIHDLQWMLILFRVFGILLLFCLNFFRDPVRSLPEENNIVVSPADGKIVRIQEISDDEVGEKVILISIFLNIFSVHVNRVPVTGIVKSTSYRKGKFRAAFDHKASDENEQTVIIFDTPRGKFKVKQIAGLIARRIHCYAREGSEMKIGDRLGFIMFGSRTDIIFPTSVKPLVETGQKVFGGKTIIGKFK